MTRVAIIGMAGRFPGAANVSQFWDVLRNGACAVETLSAQELRSNGVSAEDLASPRYVRSAATMDGYDAFDATRFGYSPREAKLLDPQHRVFLETCLTALEDAGVGPTDGQVAVFGGAGGNVRSYANALDLRGETASLAHVSTDKDFLATRVSFELGLTGPSLSVQTSTSSSLVAVHLACRSLIDGECDVAIAGGVTIRVPHRVGYLFQEGAVLSADGVCRPLSAGANGTVFGSGAGVVVLKRLEKAIADGDRIRAVVLGSAIGHDGGAKDSYTISSADGVARVMGQAMARSAVEPRTVTLVEAHATGTVVGDPIEFAGLSKVFASGSGGARTGIGSVKGNVGHLEAAAGITSLIKAVLALENQLKPKTVGVSSPNPALDVEGSPFTVLQNAEPWSAHDGPRRAAISSLGLGGTNAAVVLEEAPLRSRPAVAVERPWHVLTLSAPSQAALVRQAKQAAADLRSRPERSLGDACYTANVGRGPLAHRLAVAASSERAMAEALEAGPPWSTDVAPESALVAGTPSISKPVVAFLFSGQGQQRLGMVRELFDTLPSFRANLLACDAQMRKRADRSLVDILFGNDDATFQRPRNLQPIFFSVQYALAKMLVNWGVVPSVAIGHSLGEYAAGCTADAFSLEDAIDLLVTRGQLVERAAGEPLMATVFASEERVRRALAPFASTVGIAAQNANDEWVISGEARDVHAIARKLEPDGIRVRTFTIGFAAHSPALDPVLDELEAAAGKSAGNRELRFPIVSTLTGRLAEASDLRSPKYWRNHAREMVRAASAIEVLYDRGVNVFLEIGPSPTFLSAAMNAGAERGLKDVVGLPVLSRKQTDWRRLLETLGTLHVRGVEIDWKAFDRDFERRKVSFPTYAFDRQTFNLESERDDEVRSLRAPTSSGTASSSPLGRRIHSPALREHVFERELEETGLAVFDVPLVSFRFFVELVLEAAAGNGGRSTVLSDVSFLEPLIIAAGTRRSVQTIVRPNAARPSIEVFSAMSPDEDWTLHCKAAFGPAEGLRGVSAIDVAAAQATGTRRDGVALYRELEQNGLRVPNEGRWIRRLWSTTDVAVVEISEQASALSLFAGIAACFEAAGHALLAILKSEEDRNWLPVGFQSLEIHPALESRGDEKADTWTAAVAIREVPSDGRTVTADVSITDRNGRRVASLAGYCLRQVDRSVLVAQGRELSEWLYEVAWEVQETRLVTMPPPAPVADLAPWIVVGDDSFATAVAKALKERGEIVILVDDVAKLSVEAVGVASGILNLLPATLGADEPLDRALGRACKSTADLVELLNGSGALATTTSPRLVVVTRGGQPVLGSLMDVNQALAWGLMRTLKAEQPTLRCVSLDLDPHAPDQGLANLLRTISKTDGETQVAFRHDRRHVARLVRSAPSRRRVAVPSDNYRATLRLAGQFDNLVLTPAQREVPGPKQVEIAAQAHGLSFRDVLTALGVPGAHGAIGLECSGTVVAVGEGVSQVRVGDAVMALTPTHLGSSVIADERLVARIPSTLSFEEAATIPLAFVLAWHLVHDLARVKSGQRVLVHAASGAVGQAIVQVALAAGAKVLGTASLTKQRVLESMKLERVFSSRTQDFEAEVLAHTDGAGVDAVFHSLQPRFLAASAKCLKPDGVLIDFSVSADADVERLGLSRRYVRFDLLEAIEQTPAVLGETLHRVLGALSAGKLSPISSKIFAVHDLVTAFRRLVSPKHFGKVVIATDVEPLSSIAPRGAPFDPFGTYIVAGGAVEEREALAAQLREAGAGRVLRLGVSTPADAEPANADDIRVDASDVEHAVSTVMQRHPRTRGVFIVQGVNPERGTGLGDWAELSARFVESARFVRAIDEATRAHRLPLDYFVFHSSIASTIGIPGAGLEAILASYLDGLAHARRASGLPATAIDWGTPPVEKIDGIARAPHWARGRVGGVTPAMAFAAMASMLSDPPAQAAILAVPWESVARKQPALRGYPFLSRLFMESADPRRRNDDLGHMAVELREAPAAERMFRLMEFIEASVVRTLGLRTSQRLDPQVGFRDLGLDSLLAVELRNRLQEALDLRLPQGITFNHPNLTSLSEFLANKLFPPASVSAPSTAALLSSAQAMPPPTLASKEDDIASLDAEELERLVRAELLGIGD